MATKGLGRPAKRPCPSWWISEVLPCIRWGAATISPPKAWPMHWCPRHTPSSGISPASCRDGLQAHPAVLGASRPGRDEHGVGPLGPDARHVDGVVAEHHGLGPQLAQLLDQVVDEGVVVVEDEDPRSHGPTIVPCPAGARPPAVANLCPVATSTKGPGGASRKGKSAAGRSLQGGPLQDAEESGRYTAPIPKSVRHSPPWYGALILVLLIGGVAVIRSTTWRTCRHGPRLTVGARHRSGRDLRRLPARHPVPLTAPLRPLTGPPRRPARPVPGAGP